MIPRIEEGHVCNNHADPDMSEVMASGPERSRDPSADIFRPRFEAVFDAHHADVLAYALRRVDDRATAEDVVAETFATLWRRREVMPDDALPWLYGIARRVIANQHRSTRRRTRLHERLALDASASRGGDAANALAARESVLAAFSRLAESEQEVLRLVAWEGADTKRGAQILGCSPAAFRVRLHRARRALKRNLAAASEPPARNPVDAAAGRTTEKVR